MTADNPRTRTILYRACAVGLLSLIALVGCKSKDGGGGSPGGNRDPLVYGPNRIPPQNVPLPERGGVGKGKTDPLIGAPTGKGDKSGVGYNDDPSRFKGTHIPGPSTAPASLAGKSKDGDELKIDTPDNRVPLQPVGGVVPVEGGTGVDALYRDLEKYGVKREDRTLARDAGKYLFRATMSNSGGTRRTYQGIGDSATDAVKQVLEQILLDRK